MLAKGLEATAASWPEIRMAFGWVRRLPAVLANRKGLDAAAVRRRYRGVIAALARHRGKFGALSEAFDRFRKVTRSYWPGLFRCYGVAEVPRTNNDLELFFGSYRYHERRCSGRKVAGPGTVVRGSVRLVAAAWSGGRRFGHWAAASARPPRPISVRLGISSSNRLCRPSLIPLVQSGLDRLGADRMHAVADRELGPAEQPVVGLGGE